MRRRFSFGLRVLFAAGFGRDWRRQRLGNGDLVGASDLQVDRFQAVRRLNRFDRRRVVLGKHDERVSAPCLVHHVGLSDMRRCDLFPLQEGFGTASQRLGNRAREPHVQVIRVSACVTYVRPGVFVPDLEQAIDKRFVFAMLKRVLHEHPLDRRINEHEIGFRFRDDRLDERVGSFEVQVLLGALDKHRLGRRVVIPKVDIAP